MIFFDVFLSITELHGVFTVKKLSGILHVTPCDTV
jgi:hypothetical protein